MRSLSSVQRRRPRYRRSWTGRKLLPHVRNSLRSESLTATLIVVKAGATWMEPAQAFAILGSSVTVMEQWPSVLPDANPEAAATLQQRLESEGRQGF